MGSSKKLNISKKLQKMFSLLMSIGLVGSLMIPQGRVSAATALTVEVITWNIVGLDSNNVSVGPNQFPIGARVCNSGTTDATNVVVDFKWDDANNDYTGDPYINLRSGSLSVITLTSVPAGTCKDAYFEVAITRDSNAYTKTRDYYITVISDQTAQISTPKPREIYVEYLISQNRNATDNVSYGTSEASLTGVGAGGSLNLQVGQTYYIKLDAHTATQGYNQLESFINFPNTIFQILEVKTNYTANTSVYVANTNDMLYADACLWDNVTTSLTYRSCIGTDGKSGGTVTTTYKVKILSGVGTTQSLNTLLYDFSGSSYHYNSDFSSAVRFAVISSPLSLSKTFSPKTITTSGGTSTLTLAITNTSNSQMDNVSINDPLPSGMAVASTPAQTLSAGCVGGTFAPTAGASTLTYTGSVAASATCTLTVNVTATTDGSFTNTAELLLNSSSTGINAKDTLAVNTNTCVPSTLVGWTMNNGDGSTAILPHANIVSTSIDSTTTVASGGAGNTFALDTSVGNPVNSWRAGDFVNATTLNKTNNEYFSFRITAKSGVVLKNLEFLFDARVEPGSSRPKGPQKIDIYNSTDSYATIMGTTIASPNSGSFVSYTRSLTGDQTDVTFRIYGYDPGNPGNSDYLNVDNILIKGCATTNLEKPQLSKSFSLDPIKVGATSTLTFTLTNPNSSSDLTSVSFTDILPSGMKVASVPAASTTCTGATWAPSAGDTTLSFSGGTISQGNPGTCTAQVNVTVQTSGTFTNTSGYISSSEAGLNTNPYNDAKPGQGQDSLTVTVGPPQIVKSFSPNPIPLNGKSTLTFTISNPNLDSTLNGVSFTDNFPVGITATTSPTTTCTNADLTTSTASKIEMTGATLAAGATCTVSVDVTSATVNLTGHTNSVTVSSTEGGTGNTSTDKLIVNPVTPELTLLKEISTSPTGPWSDEINVSAGTNVYYRFTIENTGDVPLSPVWVTDNTLSQVSSCSWPATLPVASATTDPTASCVVGPVTAITGTHENTATAKGTNSGTVYSSNTSKAIYHTTTLTLTKSVNPTTYSAVGQQLTYSYIITNNGAAAVSGTVAVTDSHTTVTCNQPGTVAVNGTVTCTASYTVTAQDLAIGSVTNTASGSIGSTYTNTVKATALSNQPDMVVTKTNNITGGQAIQGSKFFWTLTISNNGGATGTFTNTKIVSDTLPSGPTYDASATVNLSGLTNNTGTVTCSIVGQNLSCSANGTVTIEAGKSFTVQLGVTPQTTDTLTNLVAIDPDKVLTESNEGNNNGSNIVMVSAPLPDLTISKTNDVSNVAKINTKFHWTLDLNNTGGATASFSNGNKILTDTLPTGPTYDATPTVSTTGVTGTVDCSIAGQLLSCTANGGVTIPVGATITVGVGATSSSTGTFSNTAIVNPDFVFAESDTSNNASTNTVTVNNPALTLTKTATLSTDTDSDGKADAGDVITYTFSVQNTGNVTLTNITISDPLLASLSCTAIASLAPNASSNVTCASGNTYTVPQSVIDNNGGGDGDIDNTATATGKDPSNNDVTDTDTKAVTVQSTADLTITKTDGVSSVSIGGTTKYTVRVTNNGPSSVTGAVLKDPSATGLTKSTTTAPVCTTAIGNKCATAPTNTELESANGFNLPALASGEFYEIDVTVDVTASNGNVTNIATVAAPSGITDPNTGNNSASDSNTVGFSNVFDPPSVLKTINSAGVPELEFRMVWINNGNITAIDVQVTDDIPVGTTYVAGSLNCSPLGGSSTRGTNASSPLNTALSSCAFDNTVNGGRGRIQWQGNIAPDTVAATDPNAENLAANEVVITFRVTVDANVNQVTNVASSRTDVDNDGDFDEEQTLGTSLINSNQVAWSRGNSVAIPDPEELPDELPKTGFAPKIVTALPEQTAEKAYLNTEVWLEIPRLGLKMPIVGVPLVDGDWDLSWLWNEAGWLEGTAFPSWQGNSVLTSHVTLPDGEKGPFASLSDLSWGDRILVHAYGTVYTYEVRQNQVVIATDASVLRHEDKPWLTLLTCETYNEVTNTYSRRVAVRAALISVAKDKLSSGKNVR